MSTKLKGDIAEQAAILFGLKQGWNALSPIGDRLSYDIVFEINGVFVRCQVKSAWYDKIAQNYVTDTRMHRTNKRKTDTTKYLNVDFDFALVFIQDLDVWYVFPVDVFNSFGSHISLVETERKSKKPLSALYRNAWQQIPNWTAEKVISQ